MWKKLYMPGPLWVLPVVAGFLLASCGGFKGAFIPDDRRLALSPGQQGQGTLETREVRFQYQATLDGDQLHLQGDLTVRKHVLVRFVLKIFFADEQGTVIGSAPIMTANQGGNRTFRSNLSVPPGTHSIAFGYTGEYVRTELGTSSFWYYPFGQASP